jgi:F-type H+-transporting ATPase subunit delta
MRDTSVAGRYARALFIVTEKRRETARALEDLKGLEPVLAAGTRVGTYLAQPGIRPDDKRSALRKGLDGRVLPLVVVFIDLLVRKKRLNLLAMIVAEFEGLVERAQGVKRAHVVSAVPLTTAEGEQLGQKLERLTGGKIRLTTEVDPGLVGGAFVRIGDRVIDRSVRTLLQSIEQQLSEVNV